MSRLARNTASVALLAAGAVWTIGFPKSGELWRPDVVMSIALSVGLIGSAALVRFMRRSTGQLVLCLLLLWSALANVTLYAFNRDAAAALSRHIASAGMFSGAHR